MEEGEIQALCEIVTAKDELIEDQKKVIKLLHSVGSNGYWILVLLVEDFGVDLILDMGSSSRTVLDVKNKIAKQLKINPFQIRLKVDQRLPDDCVVDRDEWGAIYGPELQDDWKLRDRGIDRFSVLKCIIKPSR